VNAVLVPVRCTANRAVEVHHHVPLRIAAVLAPGWIPGLGVQRVAVGDSQVRQDVKVMDCAFDHECVCDLVAKGRSYAFLLQVAWNLSHVRAELNSALGLNPSWVST
jgi:hypothetical protein